MRRRNGHLSNKNVLSNFLKEQQQQQQRQQNQQQNQQQQKERQQHSNTPGLYTMDVFEWNYRMTYGEYSNPRQWNPP